MKRVTMCNYYGMCDSDGNVMGHTCKVTREYQAFLKEKYEVALMASPCVVHSLKGEEFEETIRLKYDIQIDEPFTLQKRLIDKIKLLVNLWNCFHWEGTEILFFYQVDFFFFFYLSMFYLWRRKRVYCLIYHQDFTGGRLKKVLDLFYRSGLKKVNGIIYTQKGHPVAHPNVCWMPDFLYTEKEYGVYQKMQKQEKAVCLGTMNRYKRLEEIVDIFSKKKYLLEIVGRFDDPVRFEQLKRCATKNIRIENRILTKEEYYEILGSARFSLLPYDMEQYQNRTSGVLLESLYAGSIPIAPRDLLKQNELPGIGYENISELADMDLNLVSAKVIDGERAEILREFGAERAVAAFENIIHNSR